MTVQHIVMLEFNENVDEETQTNSLKAVEALKDKIDGIERIESGKDFSGRACKFSPRRDRYHARSKCFIRLRPSPSAQGSASNT